MINPSVSFTGDRPSIYNYIYTVCSIISHSRHLNFRWLDAGEWEIDPISFKILANPSNTKVRKINPY